MLLPWQVEQAIFLGIMRLREKMGVKSSSQGSSGGGVASKDRNRGANNLGSYTRTLWRTVGATSDTESGQRASADEASGERYWGGSENRARLLAFVETLRAGESALSPAVFDAESGRRAEVRFCSRAQCGIGGGREGDVANAGESRVASITS